MKRLITTMLIAITIFTLCSGVGAADEHIVYPSGSIQDAVNIASSGDIIIVQPGTYSGIIEINKENLTIRSESGNPEDTVIQANSNGQYLFWVRANNTTISGFKVTAGGKTDVTGIRLSTCSNCTITDNRADSNTDAGINLVSSKWNTIFNNTADSNQHGIVLEGECNNNNMTSNRANSNADNGFYLTNSSSNSFNNNTAQNNSFGFYLINSSMNVISGNDVSNNTEHGMWISLSNNNTISGNTANETSQGISLDSSDGNIVFGNIVSLNNVSGLYMCKGSDNNTVFNNYLNNTYNADISNYNNTWNTTKTAGKNIIGGPYIAGNFWAKPDGSGFSQTAVDKDRDGISDSQYDGTNLTDYLPLLAVTPELPVAPVASFTANNTSGTAPLDVQFTDTSTNSPTFWEWQFGDGTANSTEQNPVHTFANAGAYAVNVTATNTAGSSVSESATITVNEPVVAPVASFTANNTSGTAPLDVQFNDTSTNSPTSWEWQFGDGTANSTEQNPVHTFANAGIYTVNVTATNTAGSSVSASETITVNEPVVTPVASFTANNTSGTAPLDVQFNDTSTNSPTEWLWQFGDGTANSTEQNPVHTFANAGTYAVNVTATNTAGSSVSESETITVSAPSEPVLPVAKFSSNVSEGYAPLDVEFTDSSENATEWNWDFENDGTVDSSAQNSSHTYASEGAYTVNLTVRNGNGTNSTFGTITVLAKPAPVLPTANFSSNVSSGYSPLSVQFNDSSKNATGWNWDFNDGSSSIDQNPMHTYSKSGTYTVNLTAINVNGTNSISGTITVLATPSPVLPVANFSSNTTEGYAPLSVQFNDSSKNATEVSWDFENDSIVDSTEQNTSHTYSSAGTYTVNLTAKNANGTNSISGTIAVLVKPELVLPVANFSSNVSEGYIPLDVQFNDSSENATLWNWDFGDGYNSTERNPMHTYSASGNYTVNLTAGNVNGTNSKLAAITVLVKSESVLPVADFSTSVTGGYAPLSVTFTDRSQNATFRSWDVNGDGIEDSNASSFTYEYASPGTYTAKLTAINANGTNEKTATLIVDRKSSGGSSGGSSSSGGGGGSPEPAKNVEVKEISQVFITHGNHVKFNFPKNVTAVVYLSFDPRKTAGKTTTIVEMLKNQSTLTPDAPQGEVYSYLNIWVGNGGYATETNIENATLCFRVKKSWIEDKDINWSSIFLNRYSDRKWNELPTTLLKEDDRYLYFVSETPGFSPFAITAKKAVIETLPETESSEQNENIELDIEKNTEKAENTGVSQKENSSMPGSGMIYFIIGMLGVLLLGGFLYRKNKLK